ncbi:Putative multidrug export ATP-binding/permease protein [Thiorhodovibrio winogradskyi]|uniref:Multidrug export ATP-binding/permease protein n=1 Tax=Thiorhodovibrio winogradskyi TaxID=77007 RepID=A0ABZ0SBW5_9GAMM|nr:ABC transporter ATP-binding protein [Thiorhodovibrio winogradskyi]
MSSAHESPRPITPWRETYRQLLTSVGDHAPALRASLIGLALAAALQGLALACIAPLFVAVLSRPNPQAALAWLIAMSGLMAAATALRWQAQGFDYTGRMAAATHALRTRLGEQLRRMPLEAIQGKRAGELHATLLGHVDENLHYSLTILNLIFIALITPLTTALALLAVDWRLTLALLLLFPAILPLYHWRRPAFGRGMRQLAQAHERIGADLVEYAQGLPVLRAARCTGQGAERLRAGFIHLERIQTDNHRQGARPSLVVASVVELGLLLILALGVTWVVGGRLDLAVLAAVFVIVARYAEPLATFVLYTAILELIETALERIAALLAVPPLPQAVPAARPASYEVAFEGVGFRYAEATEPALRAFTASLPARRLTALVGPSGSGKTTVTRLLLRHADPQEGRVTIGGVDLRRIPPEALNAMVSVVFQDVYLFDDTVLANIRMARPEAADEEVEAAARAAQCLDFIERLPQGWHTRLGDIGGRLSGGERQRISIARALLKDAPIVVLDEPTAALDSESELAVQRAIDTLVRDKTVIVIAHRLSTIVAADQILVLDGGRLVERGRHTELLAAGGRYRAMWNAQQAVKTWRLGCAASTASAPS